MARSPTPASDAETEAVLSSLGLSRTETRTYLYLLRAVSGHPTEVARETGQSRGRIYETLRSLVEKGLVREEPSRPVRYLAVPLSEVLAVALANTHQRVQRLRKLREETEAGEGDEPAPVRREVAVFTGRRAVTRETRRMLDEASRRFVLWGGGRCAERLLESSDLLDALRAAMERGVRVEVFLPIETETAARRRLEADLPNLTRWVATEALPALVHATNEREVLLTVVQPDDESATRGEDVGIATRGAAFADAALQRIRATVGRAATPMVAIATGTDGDYPLADLDPERVGLIFLESLAGAREEVLGMGPRGWGRFLERGWEATVGVYAAAKRRGVRFRALTTDAPQERAYMERFGALWDVRVTGWIPAWLIVIDGRELFQAFTVGPNEGTPHLRHSTEPREVRFYVDLFERLWGRSRPLAEESVTRKEPPARR